MNDDEHDLMTPAQVGRVFGVQTRTVWTWIKRGKLEAIKLPGGTYRVRRSVVDAALGGGQ